jgi:hypothetical protein
MFHVVGMSDTGGTRGTVTFPNDSGIGAGISATPWHNAGMATATSPRSIAARSRACAAAKTMIQAGVIPSVRGIMHAAACRRAIAQEVCASWRLSHGVVAPTPGVAPDPPVLASVRNLFGLVMDVANLIHRLDSQRDESDAADAIRRIAHHRGVVPPSQRRNTHRSRPTRRASERTGLGEDNPSSRVGRATRARLLQEAMAAIGCH